MRGLGKLDKVFDKLVPQMLLDFGGTASITIDVDGTADPITGEPTTGTPTVITDIPCIPPEKYMQFTATGGAIATGQVKTGLSRTHLDDNIIIPKGSKIEIKSDNSPARTYEVKDTNDIMSGNKSALLELTLEGAI